MKLRCRIFVLAALLLALTLAQQAEPITEQATLAELAYKAGQNELESPQPPPPLPNPFEATPQPEASQTNHSPPGNNPFQYKRASPASKGFRGDNPFAHRTKKDGSLLNQNGRTMRSRKDFSSQRRRQEDGAGEGGEKDWLNAVMESSIARLVIGVLAVGVLVRICVKRSARAAPRDGLGSAVKFSNSCFEEQITVEEHQPSRSSTAGSGYQ